MQKAISNTNNTKYNVDICICVEKPATTGKNGCQWCNGSGFASYRYKVATETVIFVDKPTDNDQESICKPKGILTDTR